MQDDLFVPNDAFFELDEVEARALLNKGVLALYIYSSHAVVDGQRRIIDETDPSACPVVKGGKIYAPISAFSLLGGGRVEKNTAFYKEKRLEVKENIFVRDTRTYVDVMRDSEVLGLECRIYASRLAIIGEASDIAYIDECIKNNPRIPYAMASEVVGKPECANFTHADFEAAKKSWRERLIGSETINDLSDPEIKARIDAINKKCHSCLMAMNRGEGIPKLWGDEPPVESRELTEQYGKILCLAEGYATYGTDFYRDPSLAADIKFAFSWMYENMYGEAELEGRGWRSMNAFNWWDWRVGCGEKLTDAMLITDELFTYEEKKKYLKVLEYVLDNWRVGETQNYAAGRMCLGPKVAILLEDSARVQRAIKDYHIMLEVRLVGEGTHTDYGNYQHGFPYNMMYGINNLSRVLKSSSILAKTPLFLTSTRYYDMFLVLKYMFEAAMYRGRAFVSFAGRDVLGNESNKGVSVAVHSLQMLGNYGEEEDEYIKHFVKYSLSSPALLAKAKASCPLPFIKVLCDIISDPNISAENDYEYAHAWFTGDRAAQHRNDYAFALSMPSYRHPSYECINQANLTGWYMNDGGLYLYTRTTPNSFDGSSFMANTSVAYRIPGTTVDTRERRAVSISSGWKPASEIVGCMQMDGKYIVAGMDYESYHNEKVEEREDHGYGGANPYHENDLVAKKSYFMLDRECVCLGAGISSTMNADVLTVIEHRAAYNAETQEPFDLLLDGQKLPSEYFDTRKNVRYAVLQGVAAYVFPNGADIYASRYGFDPKNAVTDSYSVAGADDAKLSERGKPFTEIRIEHGKNPKNASYVYAVLPYADESEAREYAEKCEFEVVSNTPSCQAVYKESLGVTGIVFYGEGECSGVSVDRPAIVCVSEVGDEYRIKVCEPTNKADSINIKIERSLTPTSMDARYTVRCDEHSTYITLDVRRSVGEAYEACFKLSKA